MALSLPTTLCARQPIFDKNLEVYAYELLFRSGDSQVANVVDGDKASSQVILNAFTQIPYENLLEGRKGFINFTRQLLRAPLPVSEETVVIEILEDIEIDNSLIEDVKKLKSRGFSIALDDYVYDPSHHLLLELADIIKIDILSKSKARISQELEKLKEYDVVLLAEKIEAKVDFERCKEMGFTLFQGYFLSKPNIVAGKKIDSDQKSVIRLLNILQNSNSEFEDIEKAISASPVLTFKLLKLINSPAFPFQQKILSVYKAITILGMDKVRAWGSLLALSEIPGKSDALASSALIRGKMCRELSRAMSLGEREHSLFTVGLLSNMDAFLDLSMEKIVDSLELPPWVKNTLISRSGNMGLILETAIHYEQCMFEKVDFSTLRQLGIESDDLQAAYQTSVLWVSEIMDEF